PGQSPGSAETVVPEESLSRLKLHAEHHDSVPAAGADIGERSTRSVECSERRGTWRGERCRTHTRPVSNVEGRVRRIEVVILVRIVRIKPQAGLEPFVDSPFFG